MGAAIFLARLGRGPTPALRAALTSPMIGFSPSIAPRHTAVIAAALSGFGLGRCFIPAGGPASIIAMPFENNRLSTDRARYERNAAVLSRSSRSRDRRSDRRLGGFRLPYDARACPDPNFPRRIANASPRPGERQTIAWSQRKRRSASHRASRSGSAIVIVGARHELLMEADFFRDQALAAIDAFLPGGELSSQESEATTTLS